MRGQKKSKIIDYAITGYLMLLVGVMPFYFTQGYGYIATDKARFFGWISVNFGKVLGVLLIIYVIMAIAAYHAKRKSILDKKAKSEIKNLIKQLKCRISVIDILVGLYGLAAVLSYLCSDYKETALWGANGWYMGLIPQLVLVCIYYGLSFLCKPKKGLFYLILTASTAVFVLGILDRFGIYLLEMEWRNYGFISTIGNINWYCGYAVITFFAGVGLFWQGKYEKWWKTWILLPYVFVGFVSLVVQGSLSGIVTIGGMLVIMFCLSAKDRYLMQRYWSIMLLFSLACLSVMQVRIMYPTAMTYTDWAVNLLTAGKLPIVVTVVSVLGWVVATGICKADKRKIHAKQGNVAQEDAEKLERNGLPEKVCRGMAGIIVTLVSCTAVAFVIVLIANSIQPGSIGVWSEMPLFTFSPKWGSNRGATWMAGAQCFLEQGALHKLLGVGPDSMSAYILNDGSEALRIMVKENFGEQILTNAHNEWLTVLVNMGIWGLVAFAGVSLVAMWKFLKVRGQQVLVAACACGLLAYTINNMFSFRQTMNVTMFFILLGMGRAMLRADGLEDERSLH